MQYYAHSSNEERGIPPQTYADHLKGAFNKAWKDSRKLGKFLRKSLLLATLVHDLGKLDKENQAVLSGSDQSQRLPFNHTDAGVCWCLKQYRETGDIVFVYAAYFVHAHHIGLLDRIDLFKEMFDLKNFSQQVIFTGGFRDDEVQERNDQIVDDLYEIHYELLENEMMIILDLEYENADINSIDLRMSFSIMVDADHSDTERHYGFGHIDPPLLDASVRLEGLNQFVTKLSEQALASGLSPTTVRSRNTLYKTSQEVELEDYYNFKCSAPTGKGKTVANTQLALRIAEAKKCDRIFYVLPFINIITQVTQVLRNSVVRSYESPDVAINEVHSNVEYENYMLRRYSNQYDSPINVLTFVTFLESFFSNRPSSIRKIHNYINSVFILDEYHTALMDENWKVVLESFKYLSEKYNIHFIFSTGTEKRYWESLDVDIDIKNVIPEKLVTKYQGYENQRVKFNDLGTIPNDFELYDLVVRKACIRGELKHPTIIVTNTIANAVEIYNLFKHRTNWTVIHLSSCIAPHDRKGILKKIENLVQSGSKILVVSTSLIECGIDMSFGMGFREKGSMSSTIQLAGRINRNRERRHSKANIYEWEFDSAWVEDQNNRFTYNPRLLRELESREDLEVTVDNCTLIVEDVVNMESANEYVNNENNCKFKTQNDTFHVIEKRSFMVIVNEKIARNLFGGVYYPPYEVNNNSVNIYRHKYMRDNGDQGPWFDFIENVGDEENPIYLWTGRYTEEYGIYAEFSEEELIQNQAS